MKHYLPAPERAKHKLSTDCKCMPKIKMLSGVKMIVHQSFDGYNLLIEARKLTKQKNVDREWIKLEK